MRHRTRRRNATECATIRHLRTQKWSNLKPTVVRKVNFRQLISFKLSPLILIQSAYCPESLRNTQTHTRRKQCQAHSYSIPLRINRITARITKAPGGQMPLAFTWPDATFGDGLQYHNLLLPICSIIHINDRIKGYARVPAPLAYVTSRT